MHFNESNFSIFYGICLSWKVWSLLLFLNLLWKVRLIFKTQFQILASLQLLRAGFFCTCTNQDVLSCSSFSSLLLSRSASFFFPYPINPAHPFPQPVHTLFCLTLPALICTWFSLLHTPCFRAQSLSLSPISVPFPTQKEPQFYIFSHLHFHIQLHIPLYPPLTKFPNSSFTLIEPWGKQHHLGERRVVPVPSNPRGQRQIPLSRRFTENLPEFVISQIFTPRLVVEVTVSARWEEDFLSARGWKSGLSHKTRGFLPSYFLKGSHPASQKPHL